MICEKCGNKKIELFLSCVCDFCEKRKESVPAIQYYIACTPTDISVFKSAQTPINCLISNETITTYSKSLDHRRMIKINFYNFNFNEEADIFIPVFRYGENIVPHRAPYAILGEPL